MDQNKIIRGIISGYFNPIHAGHVDYIKQASENCDFLVAIINNDFQVNLKGSVPFMDENHRKYILENIKGVQKSIISIDKDKSVALTLRFLREQYPNDKMIFFNSGDRQRGNLELAESKICDKLGIKEVVLKLPKLYSSSELIRKASLKI